MSVHLSGMCEPHQTDRRLWERQLSGSIPEVLRQTPLDQHMHSQSHKLKVLFLYILFWRHQGHQDLQPRPLSEQTVPAPLESVQVVSLWTWDRVSPRQSCSVGDGLPGQAGCVEPVQSSLMEIPVPGGFYKGCVRIITCLSRHCAQNHFWFIISQTMCYMQQLV